MTIATHGPPFAKVSRSSGKEMDVVVKHISKSKKTATGCFLNKKPLEIGVWKPNSPGNQVGSHKSIATSAEVTLKCGLAGESSENQLYSGLGSIVICPEYYKWIPSGKLT